MSYFHYVDYAMNEDKYKVLTRLRPIYEMS